MFEVGASYNFRMIEDGEEIVTQGTVEAYDHPLIKLQDLAFKVRDMTGEGESATTYPGRVINVTSVHFISAVKATL